jgi:hypothetical protein
MPPVYVNQTVGGGGGTSGSGSAVRNVTALAAAAATRGWTDSASLAVSLLFAVILMGGLFTLAVASERLRHRAARCPACGYMADGGGELVEHKGGVECGIRRELALRGQASAIGTRGWNAARLKLGIRSAGVRGTLRESQARGRREFMAPEALPPVLQKAPPQAAPEGGEHADAGAAASPPPRRSAASPTPRDEAWRGRDDGGREDEGAEARRARRRAARRAAEEAELRDVRVEGGDERVTGRDEARERRRRRARDDDYDGRSSRSPQSSRRYEVEGGEREEEEDPYDGSFAASPVDTRGVEHTRERGGGARRSRSSHRHEEAEEEEDEEEEAAAAASRSRSRSKRRER